MTDLLRLVQEYIEANYEEPAPRAPEASVPTERLRKLMAEPALRAPEASVPAGRLRKLMAAPHVASPNSMYFGASAADCDDGAASMDFEPDESFAQTLIRKIDESGMKDSECYTRANMSRQAFNNIKNGKVYMPSKTTVMALAVALKLNLQDTRSFLESAGYSLSHSYKLDIIVEYFIKEQMYDIDVINQTLFQFDQQLLGSSTR